MILPYNDKERRHQKDIPIHSFEANGHSVSTDKINSHFIWDVDPSMCDPGCDCGQLTEEDIECDILAVVEQRSGVQTMQRLRVVLRFIFLMMMRMIIQSPFRFHLCQKN
jgi:hypothetical protein